jgi:tetratricopeptide (TPR) repeat protein
MYLVWLANAYLAAGRVEEAKDVASRALSLAEDWRERGIQARARRCQGDIAAHGDSPDVEAAEGHFRAALALAEELGMRPLQAHCHLGLGKLYRKVGRLDEARAELATAVEMLRELGMTHWLTETEAELAAAWPPANPAG